MALFSKLFSKLRSGLPSATDWNEIESSLIESDLGPANTAEIIALAKKVKSEDIESAVSQALHSWLSTANRELARADGRTTTVLVVGVNGTGKTTSSAKLVAHVQGQSRTVILGAADTFRAAAIEQLQTWGERLRVPVIAGRANGDPASVAFDAATAAPSGGADYLVIDTAGRLHTKSDLMDELEKVRRVVEKVTPIDEVLLVIDATTGQNGIAQAKIFIESVAVTGLILSKLDGSARGGIALAIERETGLPVKFVGTGEGVGDFAPFHAESYIQGLLS